MWSKKLKECIEEDRIIDDPVVLEDLYTPLEFPQISTEELEELWSLLNNNPDISVDSEEIKEANFYKNMQKGRADLSVTSFETIPENIILLITKIAATLPSFYAFDVSWNNIGAYSPEFAGIISKALSLHTLNVSKNMIDTDSTAFMELLDKLPSLHTLFFKNIIILQQKIRILSKKS